MEVTNYNYERIHSGLGLRLEKVRKWTEESSTYRVGRKLAR